MHNPLKLLFAEALDELVNQDHLFYVRQAYERGKGKGVKDAFLITPYLAKDEAERHYNAIKQDPRRLIYDISNPLHKEKLYTAATQPEGYRVYLNRLRDHEWQPDPALIAQIKKYIRLKTSWEMKGSRINIDLTLQFGQLFIKLEKDKDSFEVPLSEIENI